MPEIITRYSLGSALSHTQLDQHVEESALAYNSATLNLDETHNREHIICGGSVTAIEFAATSVLSAALNATGASTPIGWSVKISNNSGSAIPINGGGGVQFNGGTGSFSLADNASVIIGFDDDSGTKGYFIVGNYDPSTSGVGYVAVLQYQEPDGTDSETYTISTWNTVNINTEVSDINGIMGAISSKQWQPASGTYLVDGWLCAYESTASNLIKTRLYNVTSASEDVTGGTVNGQADQILAPISGVFQANGTDLYQLEVYSSTNSEAVSAVNTGSVEVYASLTFTKIA